MTFGFIITRHVNSEKTNRYWNRCIQCIRRFYPLIKIIVIDDNSQKHLIKEDYPYKNIEIVQSEWSSRGELLPLVYFLKNHYFDNAVIIHDSVFFHKRISFEKFLIPVLPLWHFNADQEDKDNVSRIGQHLKNNHLFYNVYNNNNDLFLNGINIKDKWFGAFGVQCYINHSFLQTIQEKYQFTQLLNVVHCRNDRCCLERIIAILFYLECPILLKHKSLFGNIFKYTQWGYTFDEYMNDLENKKRVKPVVKVWTGR
jgi:hypothetical protein